MKKKLLMALSMVGVAAAAATLATSFAYYNSDDSAVNVMTAGNVQIELVEQQRNEEGDALVPFKQGKALSPLVGSAQLDEKDQFGMPKLDNYQDKIISVKNTGENEAYVRVLIAYPAILKQESIATNGATSNDDALHANLGNRVSLDGTYTKEWGDQWQTNWHWDYTSVESEIVKIGDVDYLVDCITFTDKLASNAQTSAAIAGVYLDNDVDYKDGVYVLKGEKLTGFNGIVTIPVIAQAVQADGFANALAAFAEAFPYGTNNENLTAWFNNTGLEVAKPASEAVRPAGFDPGKAGVNVVDGLTVIDESDEKTNLRALYNPSKNIEGTLTVTNSYLDGTYAMNVYGDNTGDLIVSNSDLRGWVSYSGFKNAVFTNVTFGANSNPEIYNVIRPYSNITFINCEFDGTEIYLNALPVGATATFKNSYMNGELIDHVNDLNLSEGSELVVIANS